MPYYTHECTECGAKVEIFRPTDKYKESPTEEERACKHTSYRKIIQGGKSLRHRRPNMARQELIESYKIEREAMNFPPDKRTEHNKEIKKLRSIKGNK